MRVRFAILMFLPAVAAGGCVDLMGVKQQAPVWFEQAQKEIKGEGYPNLCDIPGTKPTKVNEAAWEAEARDVRTAAIDMHNRATALGAVPSDDEIRATAARLRAEAGLESAP